MITIRQDAEYMPNLLPATPVPAETRFMAFGDAGLGPATLSLTRRGQLSLVLEQDGIPISVNLSEQLRLTAPVVAFDAKQGLDLKLSIAIATAAGRTGNSDLYLISDVDPGDFLDITLKSDAVDSMGQVPFIYDVFIVS